MQKSSSNIFIIDFWSFKFLKKYFFFCLVQKKITFSLNNENFKRAEGDLRGIVLKIF